MQNNTIQSTTCPREMIFVDLDDTLHRAEDHTLMESWNALLAPWDIVWMQSKTTNPEGRLVAEEERPGVGVSPRDVVRHFIERYNLSPFNADQEKLAGFGVNVKEMSNLINWNALDSKQRLDLFSHILEKARIKDIERIVQELGVQEIPGAVNMVRDFKEASYGVCIVTSGPLNYATAVLDGLGMIHEHEDGEVTADYDMVISGDMVKNPKPDPESKILAEEVMEAVYKHNYRPVAMFGDSNSDAILALYADIPKVFIRESEHLPPEKMQQMQETLGDRLTFIPTWETVTPEILAEGNNGIEGQYNSGIEAK